MQFYAFHGCYEQEQRVGNRFRVDVSLDYDSSLAEVSDDVSQAVNYLLVYECVREQMLIPSHILEHLVRRMLDVLLSRFSSIVSLTVRVSKLSPPLGGQLDGVSVELSAKR